MGVDGRGELTRASPFSSSAEVGGAFTGMRDDVSISIKVERSLKHPQPLIKIFHIMAHTFCFGPLER